MLAKLYENTKRYDKRYVKLTIYFLKLPGDAVETLFFAERPKICLCYCVSISAFFEIFSLFKFARMYIRYSTLYVTALILIRVSM